MDTGPFFIDFWLPAGPGWAPEWAPGRARDASNSAYIDAESQESSRTAPGTPQGAPRASSGTLLAPFFDDCWSIFQLDFYLQRLQQRLLFYLDFLVGPSFWHVNLIRATDDALIS